MDSLVFGTDGWRDIIGERFTTANLGRAAQAYAEHLADVGGRSVLVGYDTRFNGELFARHVASVLVANGLDVKVSAGPIPTPVLSFTVAHRGVAGGVMLTASHNPAPWNGFKLKGPYGGSATAEIYRDVARRVPQIAAEDVPAAARDVATFDPREAYFAALRDRVDLDRLAALGGRVVHDAMGGAAGGWIGAFLRSAGLELGALDVRARPDPTFGGVHPEPLPQHLAACRDALEGSGAHFAVATDGDGDRLGVVLPGGRFFNSHQIFAVLLDLMIERDESGRVVKTFTVSRIVERLAAARGIAVTETPVGFKYIVDAMLSEDVLIGGEESGGIGVKGHVPERDGILNGLLLLEAVARRGAGLGEIFERLEHEADWRHSYDRIDLKLAGGRDSDAVMRRLDAPPARIAGREVRSVERRDGVKLNLGDDAWLLFRASGTEPLLRLYAEAPDPEAVERILDGARQLVAEAV